MIRFSKVVSFKKFVDQTIWFSYLALAAVTSLIFSTQNSELFEVPKMLFVYFLATIIFSVTVANFIIVEKIRIPKSCINTTFLIFLFIQILSTITSIDKFTSVFGYPSRLNGGLLSQFAYFVIFFGAIVNLNWQKARTILVTIVITALAVSL